MGKEAAIRVDGRTQQRRHVVTAIRFPQRLQQFAEAEDAPIHRILQIRDAVGDVVRRFHDVDQRVTTAGG